MQLPVLPLKKILPSAAGILKILSFFIVGSFASCTNKKNAALYPSLPGYDLADPVMIHLKTNLDEISGIAYYAKDTSIFAVDDEEGVLYKIYIRKQVQVKNWKFSDKGDYEDILLKDSSFYALLSNGNVKKFSFFSKDSLKSEDITFSGNGHNEFETIYYDSRLDKIIILCKDCGLDKKTRTSAYAIDSTGFAFSDTPFYTIDADDIAEEVGEDKIKFQPSAAAVHPITKDVYILSSVNKLLVVANHYGKIKGVYELDSRLFKQPEGITFTPGGDLLISNEAADTGAPNILIFKYKPSLDDKG